MFCTLLSLQHGAWSGDSARHDFLFGRLGRGWQLGVMLSLLVFTLVLNVYCDFAKCLLISPAQYSLACHWLGLSFTADWNASKVQNRAESCNVQDMDILTLRPDKVMQVAAPLPSASSRPPALLVNFPKRWMPMPTASNHSMCTSTVQ